MVNVDYCWEGRGGEYVLNENQGRAWIIGLLSY